MGFLADLGRAQPVPAIQNIMANEQERVMRDKHMAVQNLQMDSMRQDHEIKQRQIDLEIKKEKEMNTPVAVETLLSQFEGGMEGPMAKMVYDHVNQNGLIDVSQGGMGAITRKNQIEALKLIQDPLFAAKLSRTRIDFYRNQYTQAYEVLKQKPDDKNAIAAMQSAEVGLNQAIGQDKDYMEYMKASSKNTDTRTPEIKNFEYGQQNPEFAEAQKSSGKSLKAVGGKLVDISDPDNPRVVLDGTQEVDIDGMTEDEIDTWGSYINITGRVPPLGMGKQAAAIRVKMLKSAAKQMLGEDIPAGGNSKTPSEAAFSAIGKQADTKAIQGSLNFLEKQIGAMGSFVSNIGFQVDKVKELSKDLETFDARLLNIPLRTLRGKVAGSPLQAKYDMYLTEIEGEIGKLATGSSASIAELSATAQAKWEKIHDKNLSVKDMVSLLEETKNAAGMRLKSVEDQLSKTRSKMVNRNSDSVSVIKTQAEYDKLPSGAEYMEEDGVTYRKP